ncbi:hypothetical protein RJ639_033063 [Escallonia herrerae]|uniref:adenylate kinase n=1 Tax=Escallonia herrerae TaxID=1293975 RepID=A0AA88WUP0_9ASTE|nr:hypothetical protein RJ639_033063 [Escallonia herrerae]
MAVLSSLRVSARLRLGLASRSRAYGSAAAAEPLYDDYDYDDEEEPRRTRARTLEDSEGSVSGRGVQWVVIGDRMAKRSVYAERLSKLLEVPHISMGTLVRQELHPQSFLYKQVYTMPLLQVRYSHLPVTSIQIADAVNQGKLVSEEVIFGLLSKRLEEGYCRGENGFILDGIPRTRIQAEILDQIADVDLVLNFKCTEDCLMKRHLGNHACSSCQDFLSTDSSGLNLNPQWQGEPLKPSGADAVWKEKLKIFAEQSKPLEEYYRKQKKLLDFQVAGAPGEMWQGLLTALHLQHMSALSSQKLTA